MSELGKYDLIGTSPAMLKVYDAIGRVADSPATVYIAGESGTGKELVARALHKSGTRVDGPFIGINVSAFTASLLESELFGVKSRTATGVGAHEGVFAEADGGTLFLDEIAEMPLTMQVKILRVIQERSFYLVGGERRKPISFDARLVAASSQPLDFYVQEGVFRNDLYYRLRQVEIRLPPLRERTEDIPPLTDFFLAKYNEQNRKTVRLDPSAYEWLQKLHWLGNVRELENTIAGAVAWTKKEELKPKDFLLYKDAKKDHPARAPKDNLDPSLSYSELFRMAKAKGDEFMREALEVRLELHRGNLSSLANSLSCDRKNLHRLLLQLNLDPGKYRLKAYTSPSSWGKESRL